MAVISEVGNGEHTFFWTDRWIPEKIFQSSLPYSSLPSHKDEDDNTM
jgi:hypothetical protein